MELEKKKNFLLSQNPNFVIFKESSYMKTKNNFLFNPLKEKKNKKKRIFNREELRALTERRMQLVLPYEENKNFKFHNTNIFSSTMYKNNNRIQKKKRSISQNYCFTFPNQSKMIKVRKMDDDINKILLKHKKKNKKCEDINTITKYNNIIENLQCNIERNIKEYQECVKILNNDKNIVTKIKNKSIGKVNNKFLDILINNIYKKIDFINQKNKSLSEELIMNLLDQEVFQLSRNIHKEIYLLGGIKNFSKLTKMSNKTPYLPFINNILIKPYLDDNYILFTESTGDSDRISYKFNVKLHNLREQRSFHLLDLTHRDNKDSDKNDKDQKSQNSPQKRRDSKANSITNNEDQKNNNKILTRKFGDIMFKEKSENVKDKETDEKINDIHNELKDYDFKDFLSKYCNKILNEEKLINTSNEKCNSEKRMSKMDKMNAKTKKPNQFKIEYNSVNTQKNFKPTNFPLTNNEKKEDDYKMNKKFEIKSEVTKKQINNTNNKNEEILFNQRRIETKRRTTKIKTNNQNVSKSVENENVVKKKVETIKIKNNFANKNKILQSKKEDKEKKDNKKELSLSSDDSLSDSKQRNDIISNPRSEEEQINTNKEENNSYKKLEINKKESKKGVKFPQSRSSSRGLKQNFSRRQTRVMSHHKLPKTSPEIVEKDSSSRKDEEKEEELDEEITSTQAEVLNSLLSLSNNTTNMKEQIDRLLKDSTFQSKLEVIKKEILNSNSSFNSKMLQNSEIINYLLSQSGVGSFENGMLSIQHDNIKNIKKANKQAREEFEKKYNLVKDQKLRELEYEKAGLFYDKNINKLSFLRKKKEVPKKDPIKKDSRHARLIELNLRQNCKYELKLAKTESSREKFNDFLKHLEELKELDSETYLQILEKDTDLFTEQIKEISEARDMEDRINKFIKDFNMTQSQNNYKRELLEQKCKAKDRKVEISLGYLNSNINYQTI